MDDETWEKIVDEKFAEKGHVYATMAIVFDED